MALDDRYDRSGQYADGDRGKKAEGYADLGQLGALAGIGYAGDRRDHAVATMMGEGGKDNKQGYAGILDTIENRIADIERYGGWGEKGNYGTGYHTGRNQDNTLEAVVRAQNGNQFNNWSRDQRAAYGTTQRGLQGQPLPREQAWYDQAVEVYDDYYDGLNDYDGIAQGGTYYQNDGTVSRSAGAFQRGMQAEYGAVPIGKEGHVVTGPRLGEEYGQYAPFLGTADPLAPEAYGARPGLSSSVGAAPRQPSVGAWTDDAVTANWLDDAMQPDAYGYATPTQSFTGGYGHNFTPAPSEGWSVPDAVFADDPMQGTAYPAPAPAPDNVMTGNVGVNRLGGATIRDRLASAVRGTTPGRGIVGGTGRGAETGQRSDGTVADFAGAYGGYDAFGGNDPFGGLGFGGDGYTDVADSYSDDDSLGDYDSGWSDTDPGVGGYW